MTEAQKTITQFVASKPEDRELQEWHQRWLRDGAEYDRLIAAHKDLPKDLAALRERLDTQFSVDLGLAVVLK
jgi:chromosomal replication initiation ATPase DnaA